MSGEPQDVTNSKSNGSERRPWFAASLPINTSYALQALQILIILGAVAFSVVAYSTTRSDVDSLRSEFRVAQMGMLTRMNTAEKAIIDRQAEENSFVIEMRLSMEKISLILTDIRIKMAEKRR